MTLLRHTRRLWRAQPPACWMFGQIPVAVYHYMRARVFTVWMTVFLVAILAAGVLTLCLPQGAAWVVTAGMAALLVPLLVCACKSIGSKVRLSKHLSGNHPRARKVRWGAPQQYRASHEHLSEQGETRANS